VKTFNRIMFIFIFTLCVGLSLSPSAHAVLRLDFIRHGSLDFGDMRIGEIKSSIPSDGVVLRCETDGTANWTLSIKMDEPLRNQADITSIIDKQNVRWRGLSSTTAANTSLARSYSDLNWESTVYKGIAGETSVDVTMEFQLAVPSIARQGLYSGTITFTLTE